MTFRLCQDESNVQGRVCPTKLSSWRATTLLSTHRNCVFFEALSISKSCLAIIHISRSEFCWPVSRHMLDAMIWSSWGWVCTQQHRLLPSAPAVALSAPSALSNLQIHIWMNRRLALHLSTGREGVNLNPAGQGQSLGQGEKFCHHSWSRSPSSPVLFPKC